MILVTGATGLVGSHLLWQLLQENDRVAALMRYSSSLRPIREVFATYTDVPDRYLSRIDWRVASVNDAEALRCAFNDIDEVFHCAAVVSLGGSSDTIRDVNVQGTRIMTQLCLELGINRFFYVSSIAACGMYSDGKPVDEDAPWNGMEQKSLYAQTKYLAEQEVWKAMERGLKAVIVNPGVILGFSGVNTGSSMLFHQVMRGLPVYIDGGSGYVGVKDVVTALVLLRRHEVIGERFVLVAENNTNKEILSWMAHGFGKRAPRIRVGLPLLVATGHLLSAAGKLFGFNPPLNAASAIASAKRSFFSSAKIKNRLQLEFTPVQTVIEEVCSAMKPV